MKGPVLVIAPHPDDETLGCGGTLLKLKNDGAEIHWLLVTFPLEKYGFPASMELMRRDETSKVAAKYGVTAFHNLELPPLGLDVLPLKDVVGKFAEVMSQIRAATLFIPFAGDIHSDHRVCANAALALTKRFRYKFLQEVLAYETISETEMGATGFSPAFIPDTFVDISAHMDEKLKIAGIYRSEMDPHPFPRSPEHLKALALHRGAAIYTQYAEAFMTIRRYIP